MKFVIDNVKYILDVLGNKSDHEIAKSLNISFAEFIKIKIKCVEINTKENPNSILSALNYNNVY